MPYKKTLINASCSYNTKPLKILFYGFRHGHVNTLYKNAAASDKYEIAACVEENDEARAAAEKALETEFSDISYDEWLKTDIDAVAIGGAYGDRGKAIIKALEAGKHVIADKPLCTDLNQLKKIRALAGKKHLKVGCMFELRYTPSAVCAKKILEEGKLGEVRNITFMGQHQINLDRRPLWYFEKGKHGGTINDIAIHGIDMVTYLTGLKVSRVNSARVWNSYAKPYPDFKDCALFMAELDNGAGLLADVSYSSPAWKVPTYWKFCIWCEKGLITFCYFDKTVSVFELGVPGEQVIDGTQSYTDSVLDATETTLKIQKVADR